MTVDGRNGLARYVAVIGAICAVGTLAGYGLGLHGDLPLPLDRHGVPLGRDFLNTWFYGRAFFDADPGRFYARPAYEAAIQAMFPQNVVAHLWSYPPPFLILAAPFGLLSYPLALAAWTAAGLVALGVVVRRRGSGWLVAAVLTSPVVIFSLIAGQVSLLAAAALLAAFDRLDRQPVLAGGLLAMLAIKPQTILLVPIFLVASRRWTVLAAMAVGVVAICGLSVALTGWEAWVRWIALGLPAQAAETREIFTTLAPLSMTVTTTAMLAGLSGPIVTLLQGAATLLGVGLVAWLGWRCGPARSFDAGCGLAILTCSIFATPYLLVHDLVAFSAAAILVAYRGGPLANRSLLLVLLYVPVLQAGLTAFHLNVAPLLAIAFALWLIDRLAREDPKASDVTAPTELAATA